MLRAEAERIIAESLPKYDGAFAGLETYVSSQLQQLHRFVSENQLLYQPETRYRGMPGFKRVVEEIREENDGVEPSNQQIADRAAMPLSEVERYQSELRGTIPGSRRVFDEGTPGADMDRQTLFLVYYDLRGNERLVFEYLFGFGGKQQISGTRDISKVTGMSESAVSKAKSRITEKVNEFI